jgi:hypothetical protein
VDPVDAQHHDDHQGGDTHHDHNRGGRGRCCTPAKKRSEGK